MNSLRKESTDYLSAKFRNSRLGRATYSNALSSIVINEGGYVGGLVNEGNSCFMNSVLQSLASSNELLDFLDNKIINVEDEAVDEEDEETQEEVDGVTTDTETIQEKEEPNTKSSKKAYGKKKKKQAKLKDQELLGKSEQKSGEPDINFSVTLKELLDKLNAKHYNNRPNFRTNKLLRTMSKKPNSNVLLGYDQEDAQEFFQTLLDELEKNVKSLKATEQHSNDPVHYKDLPADALLDHENLDKIGTVYIPTNQIDLNTDDENLYTPFKMVTPLDGITSERIGCLQCGENGGIRYSVFSGMSLNLPSEKFGVTLKLSELLNEWSKPEIIEGVDCNRCGLLAIKEYLVEHIKNNDQNLPDKLLNAYKDKLNQVETLLRKPVIDDDEYKKFKTSNMVQKSSKSKQILISRPPPLLSIHINRSCFDPNTYMIRKNNSRISFKKKLNLIPWCCKPDEINLDARLPMSKKQDDLKQQFEISSSEDDTVDRYYKKLHNTFEKEFQDSEEDEEDYDEEEDDDSDGYEGNNKTRKANDFGLDSDDETSDASSEVFEKPVDSLGNTISNNVDSSVDEEEESEDEEYAQRDGIVALDDIKQHRPMSVSSSITNSTDAKGDEDEDEDEDNIENEIEDNEEYAPLPTLTSHSSDVPDGPLTYNLRSVIVHYGTHNYGHYIAFRRYRGCWWRISDENAYVVDEKEVLSTPGVFMLFYEYDYDTESGKLKDDLETERLEKNLEIEIAKETKLQFETEA